MTRKSVETRYSRAFFAGSFNPFTIGHLSIVERCLQIFDEVVVGIGINLQKGESEDRIRQRIKKIEETLRVFKNVKVTYYSGLTASAAKAEGATVLIRGIRDVSDFERERQLADINRRISGIETLLMISLPEFASLSSSVVRELEHFGEDVSMFLPDSNK